MRTKEIVAHFGGMKKTCRALDLMPQSIYKWGEYPPLRRQCIIEVMTDGALKAERGEPLTKDEIQVRSLRRDG